MSFVRYYMVHIINRLWRKKYSVLPFFLVATALLIFINRLSIPLYTGSKYNIYLMLVGEPELPTPIQDDVDYIADKLQVRFSVVYNYAGTPLSNYTFINTGRRTIRPKKWQLYFYSLSLIEPTSYPYHGGFYIDGCPLKVFHFNGNTYWFEPVGRYFTDLSPGGSMICLIKIGGSDLARTYSMPNWYVTGHNLGPKVLAYTNDEDLSYVGDFLRPEQYGKHNSNPVGLPSAERRYNAYANQKGAGSAHVLPTPLEIALDQGKMLEWNTSRWVVVKSSQFPETSKYLAEKLKLKLVASKPLRSYIDFNRNGVDVREYDAIPEEAYVLTSDARNQAIHITATTEGGAFYGLQTLLSLLFESKTPPKNGAFHAVPSFTVKDAPRYSYRGLHVDVARNFQGPDEIKKIMEAMAMYKMNKLHLHLSDDEGWRLEIPGMPELTEVGSKRCHDPRKGRCVMSTLGSGPYLNTSGSGYYDIGTYKALLKHAQTLHIQVIPEFDMPGHSLAAITSIQSGAAKPGQSSSKTGNYSIIDNDDEGDYMSGQHVMGNAMNPCMPETYAFIENVIKETRLLHDGVQPLKMFHFGGDEVAANVWEASRKCELLTRQYPDLNSHYSKMKYFVTRLSNIAAKQGVSVGAWEDGVIAHRKHHIFASAGVHVPFPRGEIPNKDVYVYVWKNPVLEETPHRLRLLANYGYKVVIAYASYFYLDHPYEADPEERGLRWAASEVPLSRVWGFSPKATESDANLDCPSDVEDKTDCFQLKNSENIVGIQAQLWTETVRTADQAEYMLFPRLLAVAERAWHRSPLEEINDEHHSGPKSWEYGEFVDLIGRKELSRLDQLGVKYRVPPPGARVHNGRVLWRTEFPGLDVEFFDEQASSWRSASQSMEMTRPLKLRTRSADGQRYSREVIVYPASGSPSIELSVVAIACQMLVFSLQIS